MWTVGQLSIFSCADSVASSRLADADLTVIWLFCLATKMMKRPLHFVQFDKHDYVIMFLTL